MADDAGRSRLGRGLAALIGDVGDEVGAVERARGQRLAPVEFLRPNARNPRKSFDEAELDDLAQSIRERGIIQPILVRSMPGLLDVFEIIAGDKSVVHHVRLGLNSTGAVALSTLTADLGAETSLTSVNVALTGAVTRHQVFARFSGGNARAQINGATLLSSTQHADSTLVVEHAAEPGGESRELFRTIVDDEAAGVFQGKIIVQPHAQKTDGRMASNAVLLSEGAAMYNKPELEIFADDVACAHGATCGALDDELLFYLMSRGITKAEAEALMIESFVGAAIDFIDHEPIRDILHGLVQDWLQARAARLNAGALTVS